MCSVLCPLCHQTSFSSIDALRCSLIKAANGPLACPICHELFLGLDKLTIHLFSHTNIMNVNDSPKQTTTPTTTAIPANSNNNNHISNHNNNEKLKTEENLLAPPTSDVATNNVKQENIINEVNFEITHHQQQPQALRTAVKKCKVSKTDNKKINKNKKSQVSLMNDSQAKDADAIANDNSLIVATATCDICEFTFRNEELRDMHVRLVHQNFVYSHPVGHAANSNSNTLEDYSPMATAGHTQAEPDFKCHLCSKTFKMKGSLRVHLKVVHLMGLPYVNNSPKLSICDRIRHKESKQLKTSNVANTAVPLNEPDTSPQNNIYNLQPLSLMPSMGATLDPPAALGNLSVLNISPSAEFVSTALSDNSTAQLHNSNVLLVFNNNRHISQNPINLNNNNNCEDKLTNPTVTASINTTADNPKIWECDVCSKAFTTKYFLKKHKRLHTGEMPYTCEICSRTFTFQQSYHKHLLYHSDEKPHVCSTCGRAFKELSTLHNHERIHSGEKPFKCDVCGKSFRQRVSFLVHTRIHTGVMPYKCDLCQKSFRYKVSQRTHKCQPLPGEESTLPNDTLDHISENFIKAFLENSTNPIQMQNPPPQNSPASNEIAAINEKAAVTPLPQSSQSPASTLNEHQALLSKAIDDIVVESCNKMGIGNRIDGGFSSPVQNVSDGSMSPSQKLQNMRLYSPQLVATPDLNGIDGDLTRFFLENSSGGQNIL